MEGVTVCFLFNRGYWVRLLKLEICLYTIQRLRFLKLGLILGFFCFHVRPWHASSSLRRPVIFAVVKRIHDLVKTRLTDDDNNLCGWPGAIVITVENDSAIGAVFVIDSIIGTPHDYDRKNDIFHLSNRRVGPCQACSSVSVKSS